MRRPIAAALIALPLVLATAACSSTVDKQGKTASGTSTTQHASGEQTAPPAQRSYTGPPPAAGKGALSGRVVWNDKPVAKAAVRLCQNVSTFSGCKGSKVDTTTAADGTYLFADVAPGEYTLMVKATDMPEYVFIRTLSMEGDTVTVPSGKGLDVGDFPLVRFDLVLVSPRDESRTSVAKPALTWKAYTGATTYEIALMPEHGKSALSSEKVTTPTITPPDALLSCEYSWWVEAYNAHGVQIGESDSHFRFTVEDQPASCYVDVRSPANHAIVSGTGVTLKWTAHPLADHYTLQSWKGNDSSHMILDSLEVRGTSYTIPRALTPGQYVYFVNAVNSRGDIVATNDSRYFTVR